MNQKYPAAINSMKVAETAEEFRSCVFRITHQESIFPCDHCGRLIYVNPVNASGIPDGYVKVREEDEAAGALENGDGVCNECYEKSTKEA